MEAHGNGDACFNEGSMAPPTSRKRSRTNPSDNDTTTDTSSCLSLDQGGHQWLAHPPNQSKSSQFAIDEAAATSRPLQQQQQQQQQLLPSGQFQTPQSSSSPATTEIIIKIVSAEYGPCEGNRLLTGELAYDESVTIPVTRDVAPFLRALLLAGQQQESKSLQRRPRPQQAPQFSSAAATAGTNKGTDTSLDKMGVDTTTTTLGTNGIPNHDHHDSIRVVPPSGQGGAAGASSFIYLLNAAGSPSSSSMNTVFGDPCPGTSKRLHVHYIVTEASSDDDAKTRAAKTEVHHVSFAEHEMVVLRRRLTFFQDDSKLKEAILRSTQKKQQQQQQRPLVLSLHTTLRTMEHMNHNERFEDTMDFVDRSDTVGGVREEDDEDEATLRQARQLGRSQSISEFTDETISLDVLKISALAPGPETPPPCPFNTASFLVLVPPMNSESSPALSSSWRLRSAVSEIVLPIVLPFLKVRERVQCRLICRSWKYVVRDWGVATTIDSNDPLIPNFTRLFLRGILSHSFSSLHSLFLSGLETLAKEDLHPAIPHLRKLRSLDLTRCHNLDDTTMVLLSQHRTHQTLEVLYIKGLRQVTDVGIQAICRSCAKLEVLDISYVPITDEGGMAIQQLALLKALYLRDNFLLTNCSIDVITEKCTRLAQLTLWGCTRLRHLSFGGDGPNNFLSASAEAGAKLVFLNLWGCHGLQDDAADSLEGMHSLHSLIVSECHRLTDQFVVRDEFDIRKFFLCDGFNQKYSQSF
jgi:hypothetical protein